MQARSSTIIEHDITIPNSSANRSNSPLTQDVVVKCIEDKLAGLTVDGLEKAKNDGRKRYLAEFHEAQAGLAVVGMAGSVWSFGASMLLPAVPTLFRAVKAKSRLFDRNDIIELTPKVALFRFLTGEGGNDMFSLKYFIVSQIVGINAKNDLGAKRLVELFTNEVKSQMSEEELVRYFQAQKIPEQEMQEMPSYNA